MHSMHAIKMPIEHSPKENLLDISLTPTSRNDQSKKRKPEEELERSNNDIFTYMENMSRELSKELKTVKNSMSSVKTEIQDMKNDFLLQLNTKFDQVNAEMENINGKIANMNENVTKNTSLAEQNQRFINVMQQENLINKMEIVGAVIDKNKRGDDLKAEVIKIIKSYDISVKTGEIKYTSVRLINLKDKNGTKNEKQIINVEFDTLETKLRIMKEKRTSKIFNNIFFDNCLTSRNRFLMSRARSVAKDRNFTALIKNNKVCIKKSEELFKYIESEIDLDEPKKWEANVKRTVLNKKSTA